MDIGAPQSPESERFTAVLMSLLHEEHPSTLLLLER
jgi:hypothetical protein